MTESYIHSLLCFSNFSSYLILFFLIPVFLTKCGQRSVQSRGSFQKRAD